MNWPTVEPAVPLARGTVNTSDMVQNMARNVQTNVSRGAFIKFPKENKASGRRGGGGQRKNPLASFQSETLGKQNYDARYNVHICEALIESWGRNAFATLKKTKGVVQWDAPIAVSSGAQKLEVHCHVDICTPRDNMLWHHVEGPHVVIEGYKITGDAHPNRRYKAKNSVFELTPSDVYGLYAWERDNNAGKAMGAADRTWPEWFSRRLAECCLVG